MARQSVSFLPRSDQAVVVVQTRPSTTTIETDYHPMTSANLPMLNATSAVEEEVLNPASPVEEKVLNPAKTRPINFCTGIWYEAIVSSLSSDLSAVTMLLPFPASSDMMLIPSPSSSCSNTT